MVLNKISQIRWATHNALIILPMLNFDLFTRHWKDIRKFGHSISSIPYYNKLNALRHFIYPGLNRNSSISCIPCSTEVLARVLNPLNMFAEQAAYVGYTCLPITPIYFHSHSNRVQILFLLNKITVIKWNFILGRTNQICREMFWNVVYFWVVLSNLTPCVWDLLLR